MLSRTSFSCSGVKDVSKVNRGYSVTRLRQSGPSISSKTSKAGKIKKNKTKRKEKRHFMTLKNVEMILHGNLHSGSRKKRTLRSKTLSRLAF